VLGKKQVHEKNLCILSYKSFILSNDAQFLYVQNEKKNRYERYVDIDIDIDTDVDFHIDIEIDVHIHIHIHIHIHLYIYI